ncbi:hypothetical protein N431DRAFT_460007 [Stipitochalara longipes BDJ]|nr:hypothetical protein N431DRAFT_460007 [Stipitochalara longipes BDJ]
MTPLEDLNDKLKALDEQFPDAKLENLAFKLTKNESLGLSGDPSDFKVFIPYRKWPDKITDPLPETKFPSALQEAFKDVLVHGSKDKTTCWIDIVSLNPKEAFFTETSADGAHDSLAHAIADVVNKIDASEAPVIRILAGADENYSSDQYWENNRDKYVKMFWDANAKPLIQHKKAKLYVGYYGPTFKLGSDDASAWLKTLGGLVDQTIINNEALIRKYAGDPSFNVKDLQVSDNIVSLLKKDLPAISWNHAKLLVVNGETLMTGGGNYWDEYRGPQHDILDHQVKIKGNAAITAHHYTNYFFKQVPRSQKLVLKLTAFRYLNKIPITDNRSFLRSISFNDNPTNWSKENYAPFENFEYTDTGKLSVLTVGRLGDWRGSMAKIPYPVQVIDAIRDIAMNVMWHILPENEQGLTLSRVDYALRDDSNAAFLTDIKDRVGVVLAGIGLGQAEPVPRIKEIFTNLQVNPIAWASRFARKVVVEEAVKSVHISQQMLVDNLQNGNEDYRTEVQNINNRIAKISKGDTKWDGALWPYGAKLLSNITSPAKILLTNPVTDFLGAVGSALSKISRNNGDGVYIVLTTSKAGTRKDWEDQSKVTEIKRRLAILMKGMAAQTWNFPFISADEVDDVIKKHLKIKRALNDDGTTYCHNKIVCVDDKLMYVGSDNAYPCYNEEHGVWIEDSKTIQSWKKTYWDGLWSRCKDAED